MEKITVFLLIFIFLFLLYSYIKTKKEKKDVFYSGLIKKEEEENYERHIISAIIASVMDGKKYKIRNIFLEKKEKNYSTWKIAGRNHNMQRRERV
jgi:hypothetical protein